MGLTSSRKSVRCVAPLDDGNQVLFDQAAGGVAHQSLIVTEQGIKFDEINAFEFQDLHKSSACCHRVEDST